MTSRQFEISLEDLNERASDTVKPKLTEVEEKYKELLGIANDAITVTTETRHRAGRIYSELSGVAETLLILDNISYFDYTQIMADLGAILAAVM